MSKRTIEKVRTIRQIDRLEVDVVEVDVEVVDDECRKKRQKTFMQELKQRLKIRLDKFKRQQKTKLTYSIVEFNEARRMFEAWEKITDDTQRDRIVADCRLFQAKFGKPFPANFPYFLDEDGNWDYDMWGADADDKTFDLNEGDDNVRYVDLWRTSSGIDAYITLFVEGIVGQIADRFSSLSPEEKLAVMLEANNNLDRACVWLGPLTAEVIRWETSGPFDICGDDPVYQVEFPIDSIGTKVVNRIDKRFEYEHRDLATMAMYYGEDADQPCKMVVGPIL